MMLLRVAIWSVLVSFLGAPLLCAAEWLVHIEHCDGESCDHAESHLGHEPRHDVPAVPPKIHGRWGGSHLPSFPIADQPVPVWATRQAIHPTAIAPVLKPNLPCPASDLPLLA